MIKKIRGVRDITGKEAKTFNYVEEIAKNTFGLYGFERIMAPVIERTELFKRGVGENTDVVEKEMYNFKDKGGRNITLRPEGTAGVARAYIEKGHHKADPVQKYYYFGPMFRYEKPQKGRYRQFYHLGVEAFGIDSPLIDVEILQMLVDFLKRIGLKNINLKLNNIGCKNCRPDYLNKLQEYLSSYKRDLCKDCKRRLESNPLRILDCKTCRVKGFMQNVPKIYENLCSDCNNFHDKLIDYLKQFNIPFEMDYSLVRGLDYYTKTVFEIYDEDIDSAQNQIVGGGRYDDLVEVLGGKPQPGLGFAFGFDRLVNLITKKDYIKIPQKYKRIFIAWYLNDQSKLMDF
ncbi:MAG: histidine--tRNA ligase, partial [Kosmotoga sp.]